MLVRAKGMTSSLDAEIREEKKKFFLHSSFKVRKENPSVQKNQIQTQAPRWELQYKWFSFSNIHGRIHFTQSTLYIGTNDILDRNKICSLNVFKITPLFSCQGVSNFLCQLLQSLTEVEKTHFNGRGRCIYLH